MAISEKRQPDAAMKFPEVLPQRCDVSAAPYSQLIVFPMDRMRNWKQLSGLYTHFWVVPAGSARHVHAAGVLE